jgi:parallel beta-helix repeat protein
LEIWGGTLSANLLTTRYWSNTDTAYALTGYVTIGSGVTLVIEPGVVVKVAGNRLIGVHGVLKAQGTATAPVTFTSLKDDTLHGDTNGDGSGSAPQAGDWGHIAFFDDSVDSESLLEHAIVRYGGYFYNDWNNYYSCNYCHYWGAIRFEAASPTIRNNVITLNSDGIWAEVNASPTVISNSISDNERYGAYKGGSETTLVAIDNWWGDPSGPYHPTLNPDGQGDEVGDNVDFIPWVLLCLSLGCS